VIRPVPTVRNSLNLCLKVFLTWVLFPVTRSFFQTVIRPPLQILHNCFPREFNKLPRDLNISKQSSDLRASRLQENNLLQLNTLATFYRKLQAEFMLYSTQERDCETAKILKASCCRRWRGVATARTIVAVSNTRWTAYMDSRNWKDLTASNKRPSTQCPQRFSRTTNQPIERSLVLRE